METDTIEEVKEKKDRILIKIKVNGYGLTAYPKTLYHGDLPDGVECNGYASVLLGTREAKRLKDALDRFLGCVG
jgi:hypothetical protein